MKRQQKIGDGIIVTVQIIYVSLGMIKPFVNREPWVWYENASSRAPLFYSCRSGQCLLDLTGSGLSDRSTCCAARRTPSSPTAPCYCSLWQRTTRVGGSAPPPTAWPQWGPGCSCSSWVRERREPPLRVLATLKCTFAPVPWIFVPVLPVECLCLRSASDG